MQVTTNGHIKFSFGIHSVKAIKTRAIKKNQVFGAVYIVSHDIVTVILLHALIDISNNMFVPGGSATVVLLCVFGVLMAVMAVYAVYLVKTIEKEGSSK